MPNQLQRFTKGALDLRYLAAREGKGKEFTRELMAKSQRYLQCASQLMDVPAELLRYQTDTGASGNSSLRLDYDYCVAYIFEQY